MSPKCTEAKTVGIWVAALVGAIIKRMNIEDGSGAP